MNHLRSLTSALPSARAIRHRMGSALPRPSVDLHLAAQALRRAKRSAARGLAGVFAMTSAPTARQSLKELAKLGQAVPRIPGLAPTTIITDARVLARNLRRAYNDEMVTLGKSLGSVISQATKLAKIVDAMDDKAELSVDQLHDFNTRITNLQKTAIDTRERAGKNEYAFSNHLRLWMDQLIEQCRVTQDRVTAGAPCVPFNDNPQVDSTDNGVDSKAGRSSKAQLQTAPALESVSEPEHPLDLTAIGQFVTPENRKVLNEFAQAFNQHIAILNSARKQQDNHPDGSTEWCFATLREVHALTDIHDLVVTLLKHCAGTGGHDPAFIQWLEHQWESVAAETSRSWRQIDLHADAMRRNGIEFPSE